MQLLITNLMELLEEALFPGIQFDHLDSLNDFLRDLDSSIRRGTGTLPYHTDLLGYPELERNSEYQETESRECCGWVRKRR